MTLLYHSQARFSFSTMQCSLKIINNPFRTWLESLQLQFINILLQSKSKLICHAQIQWLLCWPALVGKVVDVCYGAVLRSIKKKKTILQVTNSIIYFLTTGIIVSIMTGILIIDFWHNMLGSFSTGWWMI